MPSNMGMQRVVCPLFKSQEPNLIRCMGFLGDELTINLKFEHKEQKDIHQRTYCEGKCNYCEIYRMVEMVEDPYD